MSIDDFLYPVVLRRSVEGSTDVQMELNVLEALLRDAVRRGIALADSVLEMDELAEAELVSATARVLMEGFRQR